MSLSQRRIDMWLWLAAALLAYLAYKWLSTQVEELTVPPPAPQARHAPDFFLHEFNLTLMDADGVPRHRLVATHMLHYDDDDTSELEAPRLTVWRPQRAPWDISAERGWVSAGGDTVLLQEAVHMQRRAERGETTLDVRTRDLTVYPRREQAVTESPVIINDPRGVIKAVGMRADLHEGRLELLAEVQGTYAAP